MFIKEEYEKKHFYILDENTEKKSAIFLRKDTEFKFWK